MNNPIMFRRIFAVLLSVLLLCGCTRPTTTEKETADAPEIQIETEWLSPPTAAETECAILTEPITEPLPTETTRMVSQTAAPVTAETEQTETTAVQQTPVYVVLPRMSNRPFTEVQQQLDAAGLSYTVTEEYSAVQAAGTVISVRFHGKLDDDSCHIRIDYPVEVIVSLGKRTRTNVNAIDPKRIYLTFDDGPQTTTDRVLEILEQYGVRATFFTIGRYVSVYPERVKAIADGGHLLACHSYSHDYLSLYQSADTVLDEIHKWERTLTTAGVTVPDTVYFRFPGGSTTYYMERDRYEEIFWAITDAGYLAMDWTCANNDRYLNNKTEDQTLTDYLLASVKATLLSLAWTPTTPKVMLLHDSAEETVEALPQILEYLIGEGYTFGTLDELEGYWVFH